MLPPKITRLRGERNTAGGCGIELLPVDGVATMPAEVAGTIPASTPVVLNTGYQWTWISPTATTQEFAEDWRRENGARVSRASLEFVVAKDRLELIEPLWDLGRMRCLVLHHDANGTTKLMGTKDEPALVTVTDLQHGNAPGQGKNQYVLRVVSTSRRKCPFYLADATPVPPPPGCPDLATLISQSLAADINALLTPAQVDWFQEQYADQTPCPTLAELLAPATPLSILLSLSGEQMDGIIQLIGGYADALEDPLVPTTNVIVADL